MKLTRDCVFVVVADLIFIAQVFAVSETMQQLTHRVNSSCIKIGSKDRPVSKCLITGLNFLSLIPCRGRIFLFHTVCRISCFTYPMTNVYSEIFCHE